MDAKRSQSRRCLISGSHYEQRLGITKEISSSRRDERVELHCAALHHTRVQRNMSQTQSVPVCVGKEFSVPIGDHIITGTFEVVRNKGIRQETS